MSDKLEVMIIPFQRNASAVVPRKHVEYVLPYAMPLPSSYSHSALVGSIIYQNEKIPIVNLSKLLANNERVDNVDDGKRRIIIASCIKEHEEFSNYAIIANSAPRFLEITEADVNEAIDEVNAPFYSCIELERFSEHKLMVLDLDAFESQVFD